MRRRPILLALLIIGLVPNAAYGQIAEFEEGESVRFDDGSPAPAAASPDLVAGAETIVDRTNGFRRSQDRRNVQVDQKLTETAQYFADFMARTDKYGHRADGQRPAERAKKHGYDYCIVSENIAYRFNSAGFTPSELAEGFFEGWKQSPEHRENMLDADVAETGVAVARSDKTGYFYAVQMFGRPKSMSIEYRITNNADVDIQYGIGAETFLLPPRVTRTHTRCRPAELTVEWANEQEKTTVQPKNDEHYKIVREDSGELRLRLD